MASEKQLLARYRKAAADFTRYQEKLEESNERRRDALRDLRDFGWSFVQIAEEAGISRQRVAQLIAKAEETAGQ